MLTLTRKGNEVYHGTDKLTIVAQATKGPGKEVVKVAGLPETNGQQWISLSRLSQGLNEIICQGKTISQPTKSKPKETYTLTEAEAAQIVELNKSIEAIIQVAKDRYVPKPDLDVDPATMTEEERQAKIAEVMKYYGL